MEILRIIKNKYKEIKAKEEFTSDRKKYESLLKGSKFVLNESNDYPVYFDRYKDAGSIDSHYFLQDIYMANKIIKKAPVLHYDIGSRVDGFISHLIASGRIEQITMLDIRPLPVKIPGLSFIQTDATHLDNIDDNSIDSISTLHAIEHFGLGRYGDSINPNAWEEALGAIQNKVKRGGVLYLSVPIGTVEKICFNAHRIFDPQTIVYVLSKMKLQSFAYIHEYKVFETSIDDYKLHGGEYDCGLFVFTKT